MQSYLYAKLLTMTYFMISQIRKYIWATFFTETIANSTLSRQFCDNLPLQLNKDNENVSYHYCYSEFLSIDRVTEWSHIKIRKIIKLGRSLADINYTWNKNRNNKK